MGAITCLNARQRSGAEVDSTFEQYMDSAWDIVRYADMPDSLQKVYSKKNYDYYRQNPKAKREETPLPRPS